MEKLKECSGCGELKSRSEFREDKRPKRDLFAYCRPCNKDYMRHYYLNKIKGC